MVKIVWDFDKVNSAAKKIMSETEAMNVVNNKLESSVKENVTGWFGSSQDAFLNSVGKKKIEIENHIKLSEELSDFLNEASTAIENLEAELSRMKI